MNPTSLERLVVVGNGMAGIACVEQILRHSPHFHITIFGDETHVNYNRIQLSSVLAGEKTADDIVINGLGWYVENGIDLRLGVRITGVDPIAKTVTGDDGSVTPYDKLLLATGSSPLIPPIPGRDKEGVYCFRNLDDTRSLLGRVRSGLKTIVIGGGLLGLEAARGLQLQGAEVTVVHLMGSLMERQLDPTGGQYLQQKIEAMGINVLLSHNTTAILGNGRVQGISFTNGYRMEADLVVIAVGIRPNVELGRAAGLTINRGIVVNDYMETSDPSIFAVGECVEHSGVVYGLVAPLYQQGKVLAATITGNRGPRYEGSIPEARLKIMGVDILKTDNRAVAVRRADLANIRIDTFGGHSLHAIDTGAGTVDLLLWGAVQTGRWGVQTQRAGAVDIEGGFQPKTLAAIKPWLRGGYTFGSGDGNPNDNRHETFFQLLPTPRPYAKFPFFNMMNTEDRYGILLLRPHKRITIDSEFHALRLSSANDFWYSGGGAFQPWTFGYTGRSASGRRSLGNLYDTGIDYRATRRLTLSGYLGYTQGLAAMEQIYPAGKNGRFGYLEVLQRF